RLTAPPRPGQTSPPSHRKHAATQCPQPQPQPRPSPPHPFHPRRPEDGYWLAARFIDQRVAHWINALRTAAPGPCADTELTTRTLGRAPRRFISFTRSWACASSVLPFVDAP